VDDDVWQSRRGRDRRKKQASTGKKDHLFLQPLVFLIAILMNLL